MLLNSVSSRLTEEWEYGPAPQEDKLLWLLLPGLELGQETFIRWRGQVLWEVAGPLGSSWVLRPLPHNLSV